jgi:hypothetical protein
MGEGPDIVTGIIILFVFVAFLAWVPMIHENVEFTKDYVLCSANYEPICYILDFALPIIVVTLLVMLISFVKRK